MALQRMILTDRQQLIINLICQQLTTKQIAYKLGYTTRTVESYRRDIIKKLQLINTAGLVVYAIKNGIFTP